MKRKIILILLGILLLIVQGGVLAQDDYLIALNPKGTTYLQEGEKCTISLDESIYPQDFTWHYQFSDFSKLYKHEEVVAKNQRTFVFKAIEAGETRIIFEVYNPRLGKSSIKQKKEHLIIIRKKGEKEFVENTIVIPADVHNQEVNTERKVSKPIPMDIRNTPKTNNGSGEVIAARSVHTTTKPTVKKTEEFQETRVETYPIPPKESPKESAPKVAKTIPTTKKHNEVEEVTITTEQKTRVLSPVKKPKEKLAEDAASAKTSTPKPRTVSPIEKTPNQTPPSNKDPRPTKINPPTSPKEETPAEELIADKKRNKREKREKTESYAEESSERTVYRGRITPESLKEKSAQDDNDNKTKQGNPSPKKETMSKESFQGGTLPPPPSPKKEKIPALNTEKMTYGGFHAGAKMLSASRLNVLQPGEVFCVDFNNQINQGCNWVFDFNTYHFSYQDDQMIKGSSIAPGTPDIHSFKFQANNKGSFSLIFRLFCGENSQDLQTVKYDILIR